MNFDAACALPLWAMDSPALGSLLFLLCWPVPAYGPVVIGALPTGREGADLRGGRLMHWPPAPAPRALVADQGAVR